MGSHLITMMDVAKKAGVSITTVSHVINGTRYVSDELTRKVNQAARELNYSPNILARSLRSGRTKTIGLVIPDISNLFFAEISRVIEDKGFEFGYNVFLCNTDDDLQKEIRYINVLIAQQVDGIIFFSTGGRTSMKTDTFDSNFPLVLADREIENIRADVVLVDNHKGGFQATNYLISLNHKRIGCISGPSKYSPSAERVSGYKKALQDANIPFDETLLRRGDFRFESGEKEMRELMKVPNPPTAVFVCNDMMAAGSMSAIKTCGKSVPGDFSIIGFDNSNFSKVIFPPLTTISQPIKKMSELVVELLVEKINFLENKKRDSNQEPEYQRIVLDTELIIRGTCKKLER